MHLNTIQVDCKWWYRKGRGWNLSLMCSWFSNVWRNLRLNIFQNNRNSSVSEKAMQISISSQYALASCIYFERKISTKLQNFDRANLIKSTSKALNLLSVCWFFWIFFFCFGRNFQFIVLTLLFFDVVQTMIDSWISFPAKLSGFWFEKLFCFWVTFSVRTKNGIGKVLWEM